MSDIVMHCENLSKSYGKIQALNNVNISLQSGKIIGLLGPNGSGKTTFIKIANGLLVPNSGNITIDGFAVGTKTRECVSYLPDCVYLPAWFSVEDIVEFYAGFYRDFNKAKAYDMLDNLKIERKTKFKILSKGNKEKVQLCAVMSREARLYLLDEPMGGVDPATRDYILNTIITNYSENASVIISTHLIADVENVLDEVIFINRGEVILHDTVDDIRTKQNKSVDSLFREVFKC